MVFGINFGVAKETVSQYRLLASSESSNAESFNGNDPSVKADSSLQKKHNAVSWAVAICIFCTIINIWLSTSPSNEENFTQPISRKELGRLRRPSQWIGLDKVKRPVPPIPRKFSNYPTLLKQISSTEPKKLFEDDPRRHKMWRGTVSPDDRPVNITTSLSTIAEFRAIDYGMESCELTLRVPRANETSTTINSTLVLGNGPNTVDVWRLQSRYPVDGQELSWSSRPRRIEKLASFDAAYDKTFKYTFDCLSDSLHLFEFAGSSKDCRVEWWQDREDPSPGIYITQYATK